MQRVPADVEKCVHGPAVWTTYQQLVNKAEGNMVRLCVCLSFTNSKVQSVLSIESTKSLPNYPSFLELLKEFRYLKGASTFSLNSGP